MLANDALYVECTNGDSQPLIGGFLLMPVTGTQRTVPHFELRLSAWKSQPPSKSVVQMRTSAIERRGLQ